MTSGRQLGAKHSRQIMTDMTSRRESPFLRKKQGGHLQGFATVNATALEITTSSSTITARAARSKITASSMITASTSLKASEAVLKAQQAPPLQEALPIELPPLVHEAPHA